MRRQSYSSLDLQGEIPSAHTVSRVCCCSAAQLMHKRAVSSSMHSFGDTSVGTRGFADSFGHQQHLIAQFDMSLRQYTSTPYHCTLTVAAELSSSLGKQKSE